MTKKILGALYKKVGDSNYFEEGAIIRLKRDDGSERPLFTDGKEQWFLTIGASAKLLKPKEGDTVRLYRLKHSRRDHEALGYYPEDGMLKKGEEGIVIRFDEKDDSIQVKHSDGQTWWYYAKDFAVIERPGVLEDKVELPPVEPAKPKFEDGDIVRITANTNHSRNEVGDIGVVRLGKFGFIHVDVPNRPDADDANGNSTLSSEMEHLGLKGEVK